MAEIKENLNIAPYYDTTNEELDKGYIRYLAVEGQVLQNRELNVAQGLIYGNIRKVTNLIIKDGSIVSGCNFINDTYNKVCKLQPGEIYVNGVIVKIPETEWPYEVVPMGLAYLCVEIQQKIYTEMDDPSLYDPAENFENQGNAGGHRLKLEAVPLILSAVDFITETAKNNNIIDIIKLVDRNIIGTIKPKPVFGKLNDYLAQRTYDTTGDFIANGLNIYTEKNKSDSLNVYNIRVTKGRVYIKGYDYTYEQDTILTTKGAIDTTSTANTAPEIKTYINNSTKYYLNNRNVKTVHEIYGKVEKTNVQMNYTGSDDPIPSIYTPVVSISNVHDNTMTYIENTHYTIINNKIHWISPIHPNGTYYLDIKYAYRFILGVDYTISVDSKGYYITFINSDKLPVINSDFTIEYEWYLNRIDLVYIKEDGSIVVKNGIPDEIDNIKTPDLPLGCLPLATIEVLPNINPENYRINSYNIYRIPTVTLQDMKKRLENVEYNIAMSKLETQAENKHLEREDSSTLRNIFVDGFISYDRADLNHPLFNCTIDLFEEKCTLPLIIESLGGKDEIVVTNSDKSNIPSHGILTLPYRSIEVDWQRYATHWIDVAPFYYKGLIPRIKCDPKNSTKFYDTDLTKIIWLPNRVIYSSRTVNNWNSTIPTGPNRSIIGRTSSSSVSRTSIITTTSTTVRSSDIIGEEVVSSKKEQINTIPVPYIDPELVITVEGKDFEPNRTVRIYLENKPVYATVDKNSSAAMSTKYPGCIVTDNDGNFIAKFTVPPETPVGTKTVFVETILETNEDEAYYKSATDTFTANSYIRHWLTSVYMRKIEHIEDVTYINRSVDFSRGGDGRRNRDPIAQSFSFDEDTFITGIDLFFRSIINDPNLNVWFNIREMVNGYPVGPIIYYKELDNDNIKHHTSLDASIPFHIDFEYPIYCESNKEYAFTVGANKNGCHLWYAKMGNRDVTTNTQVTLQPHSKGVMFVSSNNNTWTPMQDSDVKYVLYRAVFKPSVDYFIPSVRPTDPNYTGSIGNFSLANITIPNVIFENTELKTYYGINFSDPYSPNNKWLNLPLEEKMTFSLLDEYIENGMKMSIKLSLSTSNDRVSPVINVNKIEAFFAKYKNLGNYIQQTINIK